MQNSTNYVLLSSFLSGKLLFMQIRSIFRSQFRITIPFHIFCKKNHLFLKNALKKMFHPMVYEKQKRS